VASANGFQSTPHAYLLNLVAGELKPNQFFRLGQRFIQTGQLIKCAVKIPQRLETVKFWWQMS